MDERALPLADFMEQVRGGSMRRVRGTAVFMFGNPEKTPPALLHNLEHNGVLHERVILLSVETGDVPRIAADERADLQELGEGVWSLVLRYGFMEEADVPAALAGLGARFGMRLNPMDTTWFLGREKIVIARTTDEMDVWRQQLFAFMSHNSRSPTDFFRLPPNRVVELGAHVEL
jgi:KUP system potassium uptake protein